MTGTSELAGPTRFQIGVWGLLVLLMLSLELSNWSSYALGQFVDDAVYVVESESFTRAPAFGVYYLPPGEQRAPLPVGFPLLLAPLTAAYPGQYDLYRVLPLAASALSLALLFWGWQHLMPGFSYRWCLALIALLAVSPLTILFGRVLMSEALFLTWSLVAMLLTERLTARPTLKGSIVLGVTAIALVYTRSVGWIFLAALILYLASKLGRKAWRYAGALGATMAVGLALLVGLTTLNPGDLVPQEYFQTFQRYASTASLPANANNQATEFSVPSGVRQVLVHLDITDLLPKQVEVAVQNLVDASGLEPLRLAPGIGLLLVALYGSWRWMRRAGVTAFAVVVPLYLASLMVWPWVGSRMFYPVQPQLLLVLILGIHGILLKLGQNLPAASSRRVALVGAACLLGVGVVAAVWFDLRANGWFLPIENRGAVGAWVQSHTPQAAVVMSVQPSTDFLFTRRDIVDISRDAADPEPLAKRLQRYGTDYVIAHSGESARAQVGVDNPPFVIRFQAAVKELAARGALVQVYDRPAADVTIYQVNPTTLAVQAR